MDHDDPSQPRHAWRAVSRHQHPSPPDTRARRPLPAAGMAAQRAPRMTRLAPAAQRHEDRRPGPTLVHKVVSAIVALARGASTRAINLVTRRHGRPRLPATPHAVPSAVGAARTGT